ncbi:MAG: hypothetical protein FD153_1049 [Rhodospirillaceae bacterium]|nr:MAG: hypothetical protein FD153_1049 [Rhodospirillaceae bacterium]
MSRLHLPLTTPGTVNCNVPGVSAIGLVASMTAVLLTTTLVENSGFWIRLLQTGAEAAIVGGLADWFAVTALFRHPFRRPVPHTALIPRNKDHTGAGLGAFVARHFLDPDTVGRKLHALDPAGALSHWAGRSPHAEAPWPVAWPRACLT